MEFATAFPVSAYPTLMFIDGDGKLSVKQTGALDVDGLLTFGRKALSKANKWPELEQQYTEGKREPEFLLQLRARPQPRRQALAQSHQRVH